MEFLLLIWFAAAVYALIQGALLSLQTYEHRRFARSRMSRPRVEPMTHRVALLSPCKGLDLDLEDNLRPLLEQDYPNYEVAFVVESADDPACQTIERLIADRGGVGVRLLVAGRSTDTGQKVHNLLVAAGQLSPEVEIVAFVDSDARPRREWLRMLVQRLDREDVAAATGYRWFIPRRASLANSLLYSINSAAAALIGPGKRRLVWGGSWAIRRDALRRIGLIPAWQRTLSDDLIASRQLAKTRERVVFEPACMLASPLDNDFLQTFRFVRRQYIIGRFYTPLWWRLGLVAITAATLALWGGLALTLAGLAMRASWTWAPAIGALTLYCINAHRAMLRRDLARQYFPEQFPALKASSRIDIWANPLVLAVNWAAMIASAFGSRLSWRGITYRLRKGGLVRRVVREDATAADGVLRRVDGPEPFPSSPTSTSNVRDRVSHDK